MICPGCLKDSEEGYCAKCRRELAYGFYTYQDFYEFGKQIGIKGRKAQ